MILLRHGRSSANTSGVLAGRSPGVHLDDRGREQADDLVRRLADHLDEITAVVRSPLERCAQTVSPLLDALARRDAGAPPEVVADDLVEVNYGQWTGRPIRELVTEPLWKVVQQQPSAAVFPEGEGLADVQARAVRAIRELDRVHGGPDGSRVWVACSHGDVIKSIIADAMGTHLDSFQRIVVDPASISVIRYGASRPYVHAVNTTETLSVPQPRPEPAGADGTADDAVIGGETGADPAKAPDPVPATSGVGDR